MKHKIDIKKVAEGLGLPVECTEAFFDDGRIIGRLGEFIRAFDRNSVRSSSENTSYDVIDPINGKEEVRAITPGGISFAASKEVGSGRKVTQDGFIKKLESIDIVVGVDYRNLSELVFHEITKEQVYEMETQGLLTKSKKVCVSKLHKFLGII